MNEITDTEILNWLEANIKTVLITTNYFDDKKTTVFQRFIRRGAAGQNIYSEREYQSLREMATDALTQ